MPSESYASQDAVLIYELGKPTGKSIPRIVFPSVGTRLLKKERPDAAGFCNYETEIAAVHKTAEGVWFIERTEPLIRGFKPLAVKPERY